MEKDEVLSVLKSLCHTIKQYEAAVEEKKKAAEKLRRVESQIPTAVNDFDQRNKEPYITARVGKEPSKPKGIIKLAIPLYHSKLKEYEKAYAEYKSKYKACEDRYYQEFAEQRNKLELEERLYIESITEKAKQQYNEACSQENVIKQELDSTSVLSDKLKKVDAVEALIAYFQDQRVETIKEAVNLYYEEEHRRKLEEYAQEQVRLTAEAKELARLAAESAEEAASSANEAINRVDTAIERANQAYEKAEQAYYEAQNAYLTASSNTNNG